MGRALIKAGEPCCINYCKGAKDFPITRNLIKYCTGTVISSSIVGTNTIAVATPASIIASLPFLILLLFLILLPLSQIMILLLRFLCITITNANTNLTITIIAIIDTPV